jgi:thioester reductase-like protein
MPPQILITGGTGLIGSFLLPRLLQAFPMARLVLLIRATSASHLQERLKMLSDFCRSEAPGADSADRIVGIQGDVTRVNLGLSSGSIDALLAETTHIIHGAATIRFDHPLGEARAINLGGTERMLELAARGVQRGILKRFLYIGTSSVSGRRGGMIYEHELEKGQQFFNTYEQSKCESERLVRNAMDRIPITIVRPSIVIGDSHTGRTTTFNVIYLPLRLFYRGLLDVLRGPPDSLMDLVPVDWVDDVITHLLSREGAVGKVCHVTAGPLRAVPLGAVIDIAAKYFDRVSPLRAPRTVTFTTMEAFRQRITGGRSGASTLLEQLEALVPYVTVNRLFDGTTTEGLLEGSGIVFPRFDEYAERILEYCVKTNWGKRRAAETSK